jgi:4-amino-4-deoxy-L-arabinose transferase-like glycosyltransferase
MIRGEPLLATLAVVIAWLAVRTFVVKQRMSIRAAVVLGLLLGAAAISRQWGIFLIPPVALLAGWRMWRDGKFWPAFRTLAIAGVFCAISGSWYYLHLHRIYGSMTAFNRTREAIDRPISFYVAFPVHEIVKYPIRPQETKRQFLPILYREVWGDFWMHFLVYGQNRMGRYVQGNYITRSQAIVKRPVFDNMDQISPYLRRINLVSLLPTVVLICGVAGGVVAVVRMARTRQAASNAPDVPPVTIAFTATIVFCTLGGYLWFIANYTDASADTVKASYILQTFPFIALLSAVFLRRLIDRAPRAATVLIVLLIAVTAHNAPAMVTRYRRDSDHVCKEPPWDPKAKRPASSPALDEP